MKTKLLKQIRKRYSITRVDYVNPSEDIYRWVDQKVPFYVVEDSNNEYRVRSFQELQCAQEELQTWILKDYSSTSKKKETRAIKVWWVKKRTN